MTNDEVADMAEDERKKTLANDMADFHAKTMCQSLWPNAAVLEAANASLKLQKQILLLHADVLAEFPRDGRYSR